MVTQNRVRTMWSEIGNFICLDRQHSSIYFLVILSIPGEDYYRNCSQSWTNSCAKLILWTGRINRVFYFKIFSFFHPLRKKGLVINAPWDFLCCFLQFLNSYPPLFIPNSSNLFGHFFNKLHVLHLLLSTYGTCKNSYVVLFMDNLIFVFLFCFPIIITLIKVMNVFHLF